MYTHETTTGQKLVFDDYRREQFAEVSIYYQINTKRFYVWSGARGIGHRSLYTYLYGEDARPQKRGFVHIDGDPLNFCDANVRRISRGDLYRNSRPREGAKYKGIYNMSDGDRYVVVWLSGGKCVQIRTNERDWTDSKRAALYNAVKDFLGLPGWRNPTEETHELTSEQIEIIEARVAGKTRRRAPKERTPKTEERRWRQYY